MRHRKRKTLQRKLPLTPPLRISPPTAVEEMAVSSLAELIAAVMREEPKQTPREGGGHE